MRRRVEPISVVIVVGALLFVSIVIVLQIVQPNYSSVSQFMSELVRGRGGSFLEIGFLGLAVSMGAAGIRLQRLGAPTVFPFLLGGAGISFAAAGFTTLEVNYLLHIVLVFTSFGAMIIGLLLLPLIWPPFRTKRPKTITFMALGITVVSLAAGVYGLPDGLSQRGSAAGVVLWLLWFGLGLNKEGILERTPETGEHRP